MGNSKVNPEDAIDLSIRGLPASHQYLLALSGGLDSMVLLACLAKNRMFLPPNISAIHIHHGLQHDADEWVTHCFNACEYYNIPLQVFHVSVETGGEGIEAEARKQRYAVFAEALEDDGILLTAHHQNDQAETLIHHLTRGSGPAGLAAMPDIKQFANGLHVRPLLNVSRRQLEEYAKKQDIKFVEDPTNKDTRYTRNYIRHEILPRLVSHWPKAVEGIARAASIQSELLQFSKEIAVQDLACISADDGSLKLDKLQSFGSARQDNVLRYWLRHYGHEDINLQMAQLHEIKQKVIHASSDANPVIRIGNTVVARYHVCLFQMARQVASISGQPVSWMLDHDLSLPDLGLYLQPTSLINTLGLKSTETVEVKFRVGGERFLLSGQKHHKTLKQLFQAWRIPPWRRNKIPLIYYKGKLVLIWGYAQSDIRVENLK